MNNHSLCLGKSDDEIYFFLKVLTAFPGVEIEVLVKLMQMNDNASTKTAASALQGVNKKI